MLKHLPARLRRHPRRPAAFRRLCVETLLGNTAERIGIQPPSGGCVLKHLKAKGSNMKKIQPPSGGCVLKHLKVGVNKNADLQPPSGGCVLKHYAG